MAISPYWANEMPPNDIDYVYCLRNPIDDYGVFYVGRSYNPSLRLTQHIGDGRSSLKATGKNMIIRDILDCGKIPVMSIIDSTKIWCRYDRYMANYKEIYWIRFYMEIGWKLTNVRDINRDLSTTEYERLQKLVETGESLSADDFYYGKDKLGRDIYDVQKVMKFGYKLPDHLTYQEPEPLTYENVYNDIQYE